LALENIASPKNENFMFDQQTQGTSKVFLSTLNTKYAFARLRIFVSEEFVHVIISYSHTQGSGTKILLYLVGVV
jgi:hypothetical protein